MLIWLLWLLIETLWKRRRTRAQFSRRLRRAGLPEDIVEALGARYHPPGTVRTMIRELRGSDD
jgi:hypothetical protein